MDLTSTGVAIFYGLSALGAVAFLVWLGGEILKLLRTRDVVPEPPEE